MSYTKMYDVEVPVTKDGRYQLDSAIIKLILQANSHETNVPKKEEKVRKTPEAKFRELVSLVFSTCAAEDPKPWNNKENISVSLLNQNIYFNAEKIECSTRFIAYMLSKLKGTDSIDDLYYLKDGSKWTELRKDIKKLLCLGLATNLLSDELLFELFPKRILKKP